MALTKYKQTILCLLAQRVRSRRHFLVLTQEQLAEKVNCHINYLGGVERGERNPSLIFLAALAKGLEWKLNELLLDF